MARFWLQGGYRGSFSEYLLEASPTSNKTIPATSKMDLLLAQAEHIGDGNNASGLMH